jgi:2-dehydropantoate 2-reductase
MNMKIEWIIAGAGAVGQILAFQLQQSGQSVAFVDTRLKKSIQQKFTIETLTGDTIEWQCDIFSPQNLILNQYQRLLICTKAFSANAVLKTLNPYLSAKARVYTWLNGRDQIQHALPTQHLITTVNYGISGFRKSPYHTVKAGDNRALAGNLNNPSLLNKDIQQDLLLYQQAQIHLQWDKGIDAHQWNKLSINAVINPLSVIFECTNGELLSIPKAREYTSLLCHETASVLQKLGLNTSAQQLINEAEQAMKVTFNNISSMRQDYQNGQQLEIEYFNQVLINKAKKLNIDLPVHQFIIQSVLKKHQDHKKT